MIVRLENWHERISTMTRSPGEDGMPFPKDADDVKALSLL